MTVFTKAIYEKGVLRPVQPLSLKEGDCVEITVETEAATSKRPFDILSDIAALPLEVTRTETAGREHDQFLYGTSALEER